MSGDEPGGDEDEQYTVLEATLVDPTTNKREKLTETVSEYRAALDDAFNQGCSTQSETNDVVTTYDLSGYAKNALKNYVPQLTGGSYDANDLAEDHPVRFTNEGPRFDHRPDNHHEWVHEDTAPRGPPPLVSTRYRSRARTVVPRARRRGEQRPPR